MDGPQNDNGNQWMAWPRFRMTIVLHKQVVNPTSMIPKGRAIVSAMPGNSTPPRPASLRHGPTPPVVLAGYSAVVLQTSVKRGENPEVVHCPTQTRPV